MITECVEHGLKEPMFEEWGEDFKVTLYRKSIFNKTAVADDSLTGTDLAVYNVFASNPEMSLSDVAAHSTYLCQQLKGQFLNLK